MTQPLVFARFCARAGWRVSCTFFLVLCSLELGYISNARAQATFTTFDVPGADGLGGTSPLSINPAGAVTGSYADVNDVKHGFLRSPDGSLTLFDAPGAGTKYGSDTVAMSINPAGAITGAYTDASFVSHGFLRSPDGTFTVFDAPGSSINPASAITGFYTDASFMSHGFLRSPDGILTTFDAPGATSNFGTSPTSINPAGTITGSYSDAIGFHGFVRSPDGTFTTIDQPGGAGLTRPQGINAARAITGSYVVCSPPPDFSCTTHGFLWEPRK